MAGKSRRSNSNTVLGAARPSETTVPPRRLQGDHLFQWATLMAEKRAAQAEINRIMAEAQELIVQVGPQYGIGQGDGVNDLGYILPASALAAMQQGNGATPIAQPAPTAKRTIANPNPTEPVPIRETAEKGN